MEAVRCFKVAVNPIEYDVRETFNDRKHRENERLRMLLFVDFLNTETVVYARKEKELSPELRVRLTKNAS